MQRISKILFYIFIFLLPWQTRLILFPEKPEFLSFSIYLSEIFLWGAVLFLIFGGGKKVKIPFAFMLLCFYAFLSILWAPDKIAALRVALYVLEGIMIYFVGTGRDLSLHRTVVKVFLFSLLIASAFGIFQFFNLGSPASKWLGLAARGAWNLGDIVVESGPSTSSGLGPSTSSGLGGARWLRAYGPFPHPNIFGGYLAAGILIIIFLSSRLERSPAPEQARYGVNSMERPHQQENGMRFLGSAIAPLGMTIILAIFFLAFFLTFSRSAWLALAISVFFLPLVIKGEVRRGILKFILFLFALAISLSIIFWPLLRTRALSQGRLEQKSNTERVASWKEGLAAWKQSPIFGSGVGNVTVLANNFQFSSSKFQTISNFQFPIFKTIQPPHNIFILILSELGVVGFIIYLLVWRQLWKNKNARALLILFFVIGLFDHYLWTLYSGQMLFWACLAISSQNKALI